MATTIYLAPALTPSTNIKVRDPTTTTGTTSPPIDWLVDDTRALAPRLTIRFDATAAPFLGPGATLGWLIDDTRPPIQRLLARQDETAAPLRRPATPRSEWLVDDTRPPLPRPTVRLDETAAPIHRPSLSRGWMADDTTRPVTRPTVRQDATAAPVSTAATSTSTVPTGWMTTPAREQGIVAQRRARLDETSGPIFVPAPPPPPAGWMGADTQRLQPRRVIQQEHTVSGRAPPPPPTGWMGADTPTPPPRKRAVAFEQTVLGRAPPITIAPPAGWQDLITRPLNWPPPPKVGVGAWSVVVPVVPPPPIGWLVQSDIPFVPAPRTNLDIIPVRTYGPSLPMFVDPLHQVQYPEPLRTVQFPRGN